MTNYKNTIDNIPAIVKIRVKARLEEYKVNHPDYFMQLNEVDFARIVEYFYKEEGRKYLAEVMGW